MRINYLGWPLATVASLLLIFFFSMHFGSDAEVSTSAVGVRPESDNKTVAASAEKVSTPPPSGVLTPAVGLALGTSQGEIDRTVSHEAPDGSERLEELLKLWRAAADAGVPEEALVELDAATDDPDPEIARYAMRALEDLERFRESLTEEPAAELSMEEDIAQSGFEVDGTDEEGTLGEERDLELRLAKMDKAIAELNDPTNKDRLNSLLELWRAAADAGVPEEALAELQAAAYDPNPAIAENAVRALEDLERFRDRLLAEPAAELLPEGNTIGSDLDEDGNPLVYEQ